MSSGFLVLVGHNQILHTPVRKSNCPLIVRTTSEDLLTVNVFGILKNLSFKGTLLTIFTNIFAASLNHDIIVLCHDRRDWMHPERFIM